MNNVYEVIQMTQGGLLKPNKFERNVVMYMQHIDHWINDQMESLSQKMKREFSYFGEYFFRILFLKLVCLFNFFKSLSKSKNELQMYHWCVADLEALRSHTSGEQMEFFCCTTSPVRRAFWMCASGLTLLRYFLHIILYTQVKCWIFYFNHFNIC